MSTSARSLLTDEPIKKLTRDDVLLFEKILLTGPNNSQWVVLCAPMKVL